MTIQRNKDWGYEVEVLALKALKAVFGGLERTGASSQKVKGYPDLAQRGTSPPFHFVVTKEKGHGRPLLLTMAVDDFLTMVSLGLPAKPSIVVSVKGRSQLWLHRVYRELVEGARTWAGCGMCDQGTRPRRRALRWSG